jgi:hypothetical protein
VLVRRSVVLRARAQGSPAPFPLHAMLANPNKESQGLPGLQLVVVVPYSQGGISGLWVGSVPAEES